MIRKKKRRQNTARRVIALLIVACIGALIVWQRVPAWAAWQNIARLARRDDAEEALRLIRREKFGLICPESECFIFDRDGIVFERARIVVGDVVMRVEDPSGKEPSTDARFIDDVSWGNLKPILAFIEGRGVPVSRIELKRSAYEIIIESPGEAGPVPFYFSLEFDPADHLRAMPAFLKQAPLRTLMYADFRVQGRIFYKQY